MTRLLGRGRRALAHRKQPVKPPPTEPLPTKPPPTKPPPTEPPPAAEPPPANLATSPLPPGSTTSRFWLKSGCDTAVPSNLSNTIIITTSVSGGDWPWEGPFWYPATPGYRPGNLLPYDIRLARITGKIKRSQRPEVRSCTVSVGLQILYYSAARAPAVHSWNNRIRPTQFNRWASILLPIISAQAGKRGELA